MALESPVGTHDKLSILVVQFSYLQKDPCENMLPVIIQYFCMENWSDSSFILGLNWFS